MTKRRKTKRRMGRNVEWKKRRMVQNVEWKKRQMVHNVEWKTPPNGTKRQMKQRRMGQYVK